ncbi:MAG: serine hydrolase domain-containing protein [Pirellulaceae bacterium]
MPNNPPRIRADVPRRSFLAATATSTFALLNSRLLAAGPKGKISVTGRKDKRMAPLDKLMKEFVRANATPGAALAVTRGGKLVYARGFGHADVERDEAVQPDSLFRIASVSKPLTAVAVMRLVEQGRLSLDDRVVERLPRIPHRGDGAKPDNRWRRITIRHCLQHTGGWDREASYDPAFRPWVIAGSLGVRPPVRPEHLVRYMMGQPLDFHPGRRYAYSNLGYLVLGRILESAVERDYEDYLQRELLQPIGVTRMQLGRALAEHRAAGEVRYYDRERRTGPCLFPPRLGDPVPVQYGAQNFDGFEAHGGWIASAVDLVRFASAVDGQFGKALLRRKSRKAMWARPEGSPGQDAEGAPLPVYYGCGWLVRSLPEKRRINTWHTGSIDGSEALLVRRWDGLNWAVLFNTRGNPEGERLSRLIDPLLHQAVDQVERWPHDDQFEKYLG